MSIPQAWGSRPSPSREPLSVATLLRNQALKNISKHQIGYRDLREATEATIALVDICQIVVDICRFCCLSINLLVFPYHSTVSY
jgi:hypothetical protein